MWFSCSNNVRHFNPSLNKIVHICLYLVQIDQEALVNYLLGVRFEAGMIENEEQSHQMKKIINAVIKKLIREERVLMVVVDSPNIGERILRLHPNFV